MTKGQEALERITDLANDCHSSLEFQEDYEIVKKELKVLETFKKNIVICCDLDDRLPAPTLFLATRCGGDNLCIFYETHDLKEIELLKEVLENEKR